MTSHDPNLERWNKRHTEMEEIGEPAEVLLRNSHLLPKSGKALDLACGRGGSALYLAQRGLEVHAWDFSHAGIDRLDMEARKQGLSVETQVRDVVKKPPEPDSFDLILVSYFLDRSIISSLISALKPGGMLFYQTFIQDKVTEVGPSTPEWRLAENELLGFFSDLTLRYYREEGTLGDTAQGVRDIALLVASKAR